MFFRHHGCLGGAQTAEHLPPLPHNSFQLRLKGAPPWGILSFISKSVAATAKKPKTFYSSLFGWQIAQAGPAAMIDTGQGFTGHITALGHEPPHETIFYVEVEDVRAYLDKAAKLGGKTRVPPVAIPTATFAWMQDPEGNTVGRGKPAAK